MNRVTHDGSFLGGVGVTQFIGVQHIATESIGILSLPNLTCPDDNGGMLICDDKRPDVFI